MLRKCHKCGAEFEGTPDSVTCPDCVKKAKATTLAPRTCRQCGRIFQGGPRAWYCPECRLERQREANRRHKRNGTQRKLGSIDQCVICGKDYVVNAARQKYCPDCAAEAVRIVDREQSKKWNRENIDIDARREARHGAAAEIKCVICGKMFRPGSGGNLTCSPECAEALLRRNRSKWEAAHREERNEYHRKKEAEKKEQMTPEQLRDRQEAVNARRRENYKKRMATMSPEELQKRREKKNAAARARYKRKKDEK